MKKIISGMFFRLFKGIEFWALIVILLVSALFIGYSRFKMQDYFDIRRTETNVAKRYETSGVSAYDAYRVDCEAMPADLYYKISGASSDVEEEVAFVYDLISSAQVMPVLLSLLFIPFFFGRMFSDGGIKNLIAGGLSKGKIYLSSLIVTFAMDAFMYIVNLIAFGFWCIFFGWKPPVYLPVIIPMILINMLFVMTLSAVCIAVLFVTKKKTITVIGGFVLAVSMVLSLTSVAMAAISLSQNINVTGEAYERFRKVREEEPYEMEQHYNYSEVKTDLTYKGEDIDFVDDSVFPPAVKTVCLVMIYMDPALIRNFTGIIQTSHYVLVRDGLYAVNFASNIFWIAVISFCGIIVFKKREIRC